MEFDFTNITFSFISTMIASIMGITYPLLLGRISDLDNKYDSSVVVKYFESEWTYSMYMVLLIPNIVIQIVSPFVMLLVNNTIVNVVILSLQSILLLGLVFIMLCLFHVIKLYNKPENVLERVKNAYRK